MTLSIDAAGKGALVREVLDELTSWNPREFLAAFQRWHQGQVSLTQLNVLALLQSSGPLPMRRLAETLDISVAGLTGVIDRMESRDLVRRRRDEADRRVILVEPAKGGRKLFADIDRRRRKGLARLLANLGEEELRGLLAGHKALRLARMELLRQAQEAGTGETFAKARARLRAARS